MPYKTTKRTDSETGVTTSRTRFDVSKGLTRAEHELLRDQFRHTVRGNTSLDYVIGDIEKALRSGLWVPEKGDEILLAIEGLRDMVTRSGIPPETVAVAGVRVGKLITEATAKDHWPIVKEGRHHRQYRAKQKARGMAGARMKRKNAAREKSRLKTDVQAYRTEHPTHSLNAIAQNLFGHYDVPSITALAKRISRLNLKSK